MEILVLFSPVLVFCCVFRIHWQAKLGELIMGGDDLALPLISTRFNRIAQQGGLNDQATVFQILDLFDGNRRGFEAAIGFRHN